MFYSSLLSLLKEMQYEIKLQNKSVISSETIKAKNLTSVLGVLSKAETLAEIFPPSPQPTSF